MKRKFLEDLGLEKEVIDKIMNENGADIEAEKAKTTEVNTKLEDATKQLEEANNTIKDLKKNNLDNEELQKKVTDYEKQIEEQKKKHNTEIVKLEREVINNELLSKYKAKNNKAVMALVGEIEAEDNDNYRELLDSKLKATSEADDTRFMFGDLKVETRYNPVAGNGDTTVTKEQFQKMGYTERVALYNENKELYTKLSNE